MALLLLEGFDDGLRDDRWVTASLPSPAASIYNRLGNSQTIVGTSDYMRYNLNATEEHATITIGMLFRRTASENLPSVANGFFQFRSDAGATTHISVA